MTLYGKLSPALFSTPQCNLFLSLLFQLATTTILKNVFILLHTPGDKKNVVHCAKFVVTKTWK